MNAAEISQRLSANAAAVASYLLPNGKKAGPEWKAGNTAGEPGGSLSVRLTGAKAGVWKDFQSGDGGDLLDLWSAVRGLSVAEAMAEAKQYLGVRDTMPQRQQKTYAVPAKPKAAMPTATLDWLTGRGLTAETIEAFKVREVRRNGEPWALFPYLRDGVYVNGKYRNPADKKGMQQEKDAEPCLFGWHLIDPKARTVAITEGEVDAMTLHQVGLPALSVNAGAGNHQWIENDWDRLERFSEILVCFDNDEAGDKGAAEVINRLGLERCKRMRVGAKDANQWLQDGATPEQFREAAKTAKSMTRTNCAAPRTSWPGQGDVLPGARRAAESGAAAGSALRLVRVPAGRVDRVDRLQRPRQEPAAVAGAAWAHEPGRALRGVLRRDDAGVPAQAHGEAGHRH
jgi:twinkle protein